jgi:hypothetical protein
LGDKKPRTGRSPTSPSRQRRKHRDQQQPLTQQQQSALLTYHASSRSSDYSRFAPNTSVQHQSRNQQRHGVRTHMQNSGTEILHFPAEYQVYTIVGKAWPYCT